MNDPRLNALLADVKRRHGSFPEHISCICRDLALYRAAHAAPERSLAQLRGNTVLEAARLAPVELTGDWTLAGEHLADSAIRWCTFTLGTQLPDRFTDAEIAAELAKYAPELTPEQLRAEVARLQIPQNSARAAGEASPEAGFGACDWCAEDTDGVFTSGGWRENHSIRDYAKLLRLGYGGLRRELEDELARHPLHSLDYVRRENFLRAAMAVCDAGIELGRRWAVEAETAAAACLDPERRKRLAAMARNCRRVPEHGAATLAEAIQSLWFGHIITCAEDAINANSLGRLDQILNPYYLSDLAAGRITRDEAKVLLLELAIKLYLEYDVQAITLGGVAADGKCAVNEMSYLLLEVTEEFGEIRDLSVRIDSETPPAFLEKCARQVIKGGGIPFFFNDESFIPALTRRGIALEDARNYAPIGCVELTIPGRANPHAVSGWFNMLKTLELTLHNGRNPDTGHQVGPTTGELADFKDFDALMAAYRRQIEFFASRMIYHCRRGELQQQEFGALPGQSLLTDDCIRRGCDLTDGGCVYNFHEICCMGVPDCADALIALKQLYFEEKAIGATELLEAMSLDFQGHENLRNMLLTRVPKYGNSIDAVDHIARELSSYFIGLMDAWSEPHNQLLVHLFTFVMNINFGKKVGAMPDGRRAGEPLAYSLSAHQGRDLAGVTAMLHTLSQMPHQDAGGGSAAIIDLHPSIFEQMETPERFMAQILRGAIASGVGQMQWNVVSAERLEQAKADPEHYGNIPVRVAGYSQMFQLLDPALQDHVIARYKHSAI